MGQLTDPFLVYHTFASAGGSTPSAWMLVLHGIYGSGANWRTFARQLVARRPDWGAVLVDLRLHGKSQGAPPPHTVAAAAADLDLLARRLADQGKTVRAVSGHSFGGKVALRYRGHAPPQLAQTWVLDASPGARPGAIHEQGNTVVAVLDMLDSLPDRFPSRAAFVDLVAERGLPTMLGNWLAMNLERVDGDYLLRLDLAGVRSLLVDYYATDLFPGVEDSSCSGELHVVVAAKSQAVPAADRDRLDCIAAGNAPVTVHRIEGAGHWVHIEALPALLDLFAERLA